MPASVPNTSTLALTNATFPYVMKLAQHGAREAILRDDGIGDGVNTYEGTLTCEAVAVSQKKGWKPVREILGSELVA
jgi:alanine dehydrogenase